MAAEPARTTPTVTDRGGARVRMRVVRNPDVEPDPADSALESTTRVRAIPRWAPKDQAAKMRDAASPHVAGLRDAATGGWVVRERPPALAWVWSHVIPARGESANPGAWAGMAAAGLVRALIHSVLYLGLLATATRTRAAVAAVLGLLVALVYAAANAVG